MTLEIRRGHVPVEGGEIFYELCGEGPPVILVHGDHLDRRMWEPQLEDFSHQHRVIRYDQRGFGKSSTPGSDGPIPHPDDLARLMDYLKVPKASIVGASIGGRHALDFALEHPERTQALVLVGSALGGWRDSDRAKAARDSVRAAFETGGAQAARKLLLDGGELKHAVDRGSRDFFELILQENSGWHWEHEQPFDDSEALAVERLSEIAAPTLIVVGERDETDARDIAGLLHEKIEGSKLTQLSELGHLPNIEDPVRFNALVMGFLRRANDES